MVNTEVGTEYSTFAAGVFVFNLIVGVGVLALPSGFMSAGLVIDLIQTYHFVLKPKKYLKYHKTP
jgi:amino acid permease